jgi:hypothetical protein
LDTLSYTFFVSVYFILFYFELGQRLCPNRLIKEFTRKFRMQVTKAYSPGNNSPNPQSSFPFNFINNYKQRGELITETLAFLSFQSSHTASKVSEAKALR